MQRLIKFSLMLALLALAACGRGEISNPLAGAQATAAAQVATAQAQINGPLATAQAMAGTAQAGMSDAASTAQAVQATLSALATQAQPTTSAFATQAASVAATLRASVITPEDAKNVINQYAQEVLGASITIIQAGGLTNDVDRQLTLPQEGEAAQTGSVRVAVRTYGAVLEGGAASVSYGQGVVSGDVSMDISAASFGAFSLSHTGALPGTEAEALALALQYFPALADRAFVAQPTDRGFAWHAEGQVPGFDLQTLQATLVAERVLLGVMPASAGRLTIYVTVGKGSFAAQVGP